MGQDAMVVAVKAGLKGELDSVSTYEDAAAKAEGEVRAFFLERAGEEKKHYNWLLEYYRQLVDHLNPERNLAAELSGEWKPSIISEDFLARVGKSRQLSAAVSAAVLLEMNSIRHYRDAASAATIPALKAFFETLVTWEEKHYHDLLKIQEESERYYWDANNWEPF